MSSRHSRRSVDLMLLYCLCSFESTQHLLGCSIREVGVELERRDGKFIPSKQIMSCKREVLSYCYRFRVPLGAIDADDICGRNNWSRITKHKVMQRQMCRPQSVRISFHSSSFHQTRKLLQRGISNGVIGKQCCPSLGSRVGMTGASQPGADDPSSKRRSETADPPGRLQRWRPVPQ